MKVINRRIRFDYEILKEYEVGIELNGAEVKAVKRKDVDLSRAYVKLIDNQVYLVNGGIALYGDGEQDPRRSRRLLLHRREIAEIQGKMGEKKLTLVPMSVYTKGRLVKLEIALAHSKREFEKKEKIKKRDIERELQRTFRGPKQ